MEYIELINAYGLPGLIVVIGLIFWKTRLIEYFFFNDFDRMFWSSSKKSISRIINSLVIVFFIFMMIVFFGSQVRDLPDLSMIIIYTVTVLLVTIYLYSYICYKKEWKLWKIEPITGELINVIAGLTVSISIILSYWLFNYDYTTSILLDGSDNSILAIIIVNAFFCSILLTKLLLSLAKFANIFRDKLYLVKDEDKYILISVADNDFFILQKMDSNVNIIVKRDDLDKYVLVKGPLKIK